MDDVRWLMYDVKKILHYFIIGANFFVLLYANNLNYEKS
jgi:hypothetical protein